MIRINEPVMGLGDEELRRIAVPTAIVPYYDWIHPHTSAAHAHKMILGSRLFDFDPTRYERRLSRGTVSQALERIGYIARRLTGGDGEQETTTVAAILCDFESSL